MGGLPQLRNQFSKQIKTISQQYNHSEKSSPSQQRSLETTKVIGWKLPSVDKIHSQKSADCGHNYIKPFHIPPHPAPAEQPQFHKQS
jgi:hypothetical protein